MIGLEYLLAGHMILADFKPTCVMKTAPQITVSASGLDTVYDNSKNIRELDGFKPKVNSNPYDKDVETHIEGLTHGMIGASGGYQFSTETWPDLNKVCLYVSRVDVRLKVEPTVYIAHEFQKGTCRYNAVMGMRKNIWRSTAPSSTNIPTSSCRASTIL